MFNHVCILLFLAEIYLFVNYMIEKNIKNIVVSRNVEITFKNPNLCHIYVFLCKILTVTVIQIIYIYMYVVNSLLYIHLLYVRTKHYLVIYAYCKIVFTDRIVA